MAAERKRDLLLGRQTERETDSRDGRQKKRLTAEATDKENCHMGAIYLVSLCGGLDKRLVKRIEGQPSRVFKS